MINSIRELCKKNNITITKLEEELKFSQGLISRWKDKTPSLDKIVDIADYFHISLDEVVGYNQNINDEFLQVLYNETNNKHIEWLPYERIQKMGYKPKRFRFDYDDNDYTQDNYFFMYGQGYIVFYANYKPFEILYPESLAIFIQPSDDSDLIEQKYETKDLSKLWIKILNSLEEVPDEIKAENLKNKFLNEFNKPTRKKNVIYVPRPSSKIKIAEEALMESIIETLSQEKGNFLMTKETLNFVDQNSYTGITDISKEFYYRHKTIIGKIVEAKLINHQDLYLISETHIMKLSGFTWGKQCGTHGFNGLLEVLNDAGFEVNAHTNFDGKDFSLLPPCNK